ncbi:unnamed protein product [Enterobius vermicularis]|uniref:F-box domain-containing protein n=1 Tax=Enterobius vermicularis TaxID=51028 RepID=A0A0N4VFV0_ENTVE|nr:unnamed protein product [Enterobius vermicularis]
MYQKWDNEEIDFTQLKQRVIIPNLPDLVLCQIFETFSYRELVRLEVICKRWRSIIARILKKEIRELNVEQSVTYNTVSAHQQKPFKRLSICCNFEAYDFLTGILKRSRLSINKLSCDVKFLTNIDQLPLNREASRRYWSNVEDLWLILARLDNQTTQKFLDIEKELFLNLSQMTAQIHEGFQQAGNVAKIISAIVSRFPSIQISMEIHAKSSNEVFAQLLALSPMELKSLKIICLDYDLAVLSLTYFSRILQQRGITMHRLTLRDWTIRCEPSQVITHSPLETLRLSSCAVENVDNFVSAVRETFTAQKNSNSHVSRKQNRPLELKGSVLSTKENISFSNHLIKNQPRNGGFADRCFRELEYGTNKPFIEKLEVAGQCTFHGLGFLNDKAHTEFQFRINSVAPSLVIDSSRIYYYE